MFFKGIFEERAEFVRGSLVKSRYGGFGYFIRDFVRGLLVKGGLWEKMEFAKGDEGGL